MLRVWSQLTAALKIGPQPFRSENRRIEARGDRKLLRAADLQQKVVLFIEMKRCGRSGGADKDVRARGRQSGCDVLGRTPELLDNLVQQRCVMRIRADIAQLHPRSAALNLRQNLHGRQIRPCQVSIDEGTILLAAFLYLVDGLVAA